MDGLVFTYGDSWRRRRWHKLLDLAVKGKTIPKSQGRSGTNRLWLHDMRRSYACFVGEHTESHVVMGLWGHKDIRTTMRYLQGTEKRKKEAADAFGKAWEA
jgi:integrase